MDKKTPLDLLLNTWQAQPEILQNIAYWQTEPAKAAELVEYPADLSTPLIHVLQKEGISGLYCHQAQAYQVAMEGQNFVVVTSTASGKTLCYNLPVFQMISASAEDRALFVFPTKALTQDQWVGLKKIIPGISATSSAAIYDGDTPLAQRVKIREKSQVILTNPDMLHISILPHHTLWAEFFHHLRFVVIDEIHIYRGVFGSHIANLIRRLKRVASFYGARPQFLMTSATIGNPRQHAERLVEAPVTVIDRDGAPHGARNFLLYNPPIVNSELGLRKSASSEALHLSGDLLAYQVQTILFAKARRSVEMILRNLQNRFPDQAHTIRGYRSGYLASERREIEQSLRSGLARMVVATNALELGIDIGDLDASMMVGYPGTIAATRQQAGRAGRRTGASLAILLASASPLDQFLMKHPAYVFGKSPEHAYIDPDNLLILLSHLRCTVFELPFQIGEKYGSAPQDLIEGLLEILDQEKSVHLSKSKYYWTSDQYPANKISLRTTTEGPILIQAEMDNRWVSVGEIDETSAKWMVHPNAIYLHEGQEYEVQSLDLEKHLATIKPISADYYTEALKNVSIEKIAEFRQEGIRGGSKHYGDILVTTQITGFRRLRWGSFEVLGEDSLDLPPSVLRTTAFWIALDESVVDQLRVEGQWTNDPNSYGTNWSRQKKSARERDHFTCQNCGLVEQGSAHHVHHKTPFRSFQNFIEANRLENLITLCPACHILAEQSLKMRSGLAGLGYAMQQLAPLFLMCDISDIGLASDPKSPLTDGAPTITIYDLVPAGIGLSDQLYQIEQELFQNVLEMVANCDCLEGCPSCVGPSGENGSGGKAETIAILRHLCGR